MAEIDEARPDDSSGRCATLAPGPRRTTPLADANLPSRPYAAIGHRGWLWLLAGALLAGLVLCGCASVWLAPIQLVALIDGLPPDANVSLLSDVGDPLPVHMAPLPEPSQLCVTAAGRRNPSASATTIILTPFTNRHDAQVRPDGYHVGAGWVLAADGTCWTATPAPETPAELCWSGQAEGTLHAGLLMHPAGGIVVLQWNDEAPETIDTYSPDTRWVSLDCMVPIHRAKLVARVPYASRHVGLCLASGSAICRRITLIWGERTLHDQRLELSSGTEPTTISVPAPGRARLLLWAAQNALTTVGCSLVHWAFCALLGLPIVMLVRGRLGLIENCAIALAGGNALSIVGTATLVWLGLTGSTAFHVLLTGGAIVMAVVLAGGAIRAMMRRAWPYPATHEARVLPVLLIVGMVSSLIMFYPLLSFPTWFLGHAYTDSYHYFNFAEAFRMAPSSVLLDSTARAAEHYTHLVQGEAVNLDRTGDVLGLLNSALTANRGTRAAYAQHHFNYWFMLPLLTYALLGRMVASPGVRCAGVLLIATSANLYALFTQCYLAHFVSVLLLLVAVLLGGLYCDEARRGRLRPVQHLGFVLSIALTLAGQLATYPGQFLFPAVFAGVLLGQALYQRSWRPVAMLVAVALGTAALSNYTLYALAHFDAQQPLASLNDLARNLVFPFYGDPLRFGATILGLADWVQVSRLARSIGSALGEFGAVWTSLLIKPVLPLRLFALFVTAALTVFGLIRLRHGPRSTCTVLLVGATGLFALASAALFAVGQVYLPSKLLVTVGLLWLFLIVVGIDRLCAHAPRWGALVGSATAFSLIISNLASAWFDNSLWLLPLYHPVLYRARTHVGVLTEDLRELSQAVIAEPLPRPDTTVVILGNDECARGTDRDRVLTAHVDNIFAPYWVQHDPPPAAWPASDFAWVLVFSGRTLPPAIVPRARAAIENATFTLYTVAAAPACETAPRQTE